MTDDEEVGSETRDDYPDLVIDPKCEPGEALERYGPVTRDELAQLRIRAYNSDTGQLWEAVGNTLYYGKRRGEWIAIPGGITMILHMATAQPREVLRLVDEIERLKKDNADLNTRIAYWIMRSNQQEADKKAAKAETARRRSEGAKSG